jgi:hypothetical protein
MWTNLRTCIGGALVAGCMGAFGATNARAEPATVPATLPDLDCVAEQTGGFHDYPAEGERYEPALFHPQAFRLAENTVFMLNLLESERRADLYLTLESQAPAEEDGTTAPEVSATELECRQVRGADGSTGYSCVNLPPSEMLLINARTLRYTRAAVGAWTFAEPTAAETGDSIFVEYGQCREVASAEAPAGSNAPTPPAQAPQPPGQAPQSTAPAPRPPP